MTLRRQSAKRAREQKQRRELAGRHHGPQRCQFPTGCADEAVDQDERLTRGRGGSAVDPDNIVLLCRWHHDWKHGHPLEARAMGLMPNSWDQGPIRVLHEGGKPANVPVVSNTANHSPAICFRTSKEGIDWIDKMARTDPELTRTDVVKACLVLGSQQEEKVLARLKATALAGHPKKESQ